MKNSGRSVTTLIATASLVAFGIFGASQAASASPIRAASPQAQLAAAIESGTAIAIPMVAVPNTGASTSGVHTDIRITENCGTAFLYPSAAANHIHYDFRFEGLHNGSFWVNAHVGAQNLYNGEADAHSYSDAALGSSWEK